MWKLLNVYKSIKFYRCIYNSRRLWRQCIIFKMIHPRCVLDNKNHSRFSRTQFIYSVSSTQQHVSAQRALRIVKHNYSILLRYIKQTHIYIYIYIRNWDLSFHLNCVFNFPFLQTGWWPIRRKYVIDFILNKLIVVFVWTYCDSRWCITFRSIYFTDWSPSLVKSITKKYNTTFRGQGRYPCFRIKHRYKPTSFGPRGWE